MNFRSGQSNHIQALIHETISLDKQGDFLDPQFHVDKSSGLFA